MSLEKATCLNRASMTDVLCWLQILHVAMIACFAFALPLIAAVLWRSKLRFCALGLACLSIVCMLFLGSGGYPPRNADKAAWQVVRDGAQPGRKSFGNFEGAADLIGNSGAHDLAEKTSSGETKEITPGVWRSVSAALTKILITFAVAAFCPRPKPSSQAGGRTHHSHGTRIFHPTPRLRPSLTMHGRCERWQTTDVVLRGSHRDAKIPGRQGPW